MKKINTDVTSLSYRVNLNQFFIFSNPIEVDVYKSGTRLYSICFSFVLLSGNYTNEFWHMYLAIKGTKSINTISINTTSADPTNIDVNSKNVINKATKKPSKWLNQKICIKGLKLIK